MITVMRVWHRGTCYGIQMGCMGLYVLEQSRSRGEYFGETGFDLKGLCQSQITVLWLTKISEAKYLTNLHFYNTWSYYRNTSHSWLTPQKCSALVTFAFTGEVASLPAVARCMSALGLIVPQEVVRFPHPSTTVREMHPSSTCQNPVNFQVWHLDCLTDTCAVDVFCDSWRDRSSSNFWFVIESMVTSCSHLHCPAFVLETLVDFFQIY